MYELTKPCCQLDENGYFTGLTVADLDPLAGDGSYLLPKLCVFADAPEYIAEKVVKFLDGNWIYEDDFRGKTVYSTINHVPEIVGYIGSIKEGYTLDQPTSSFHVWNGTDWIDPRTPQEIAAYNRSLLPALPKRQFALYLYDHGLYDQVMTELDRNPRFKIEYENAKELERLSPTVSDMSAMLGWNDEEVDRMWAEALTL